MEKNDSKKGLAGLSSMISDVQAIEQQAREQAVSAPQDGHDKDNSHTVNRKTSRQKQTSTTNVQQSNGRGCIVSIVLVFLLFLFFAAVGGRSSTSSKPQQTRTNTTNSSSATPKPPNSSSKKTNETPSPKKNVATGYDDNHSYLNDNGFCEITIDNTKNDMPVYVRIWDMNKHKPVRAFYIRQGGTFTADELTPGRYEIRYRELYENGVPSYGTKSQIYTMEQHRTPTGTQYDTLSLTLYKVRNGNARTERIDAGDI